MAGGPEVNFAFALWPSAKLFLSGDLANALSVA